MSATEDNKRELGELSDKGNSLREKIKNESASQEFIEGYQEWYTRAIKIISLIGKDRLDEFCSYYLPDSNRNNIILTDGTYVIQDYIFGVKPLRRPGVGVRNIPRLINSKFSSQLAILNSMSQRLNDIEYPNREVVELRNQSQEKPNVMNYMDSCTFVTQTGDNATQVNQLITVENVFNLLEEDLTKSNASKNAKESALQKIKDLKNDPVFSQIIAQGIITLAGTAGAIGLKFIH